MAASERASGARQSRNIDAYAVSAPPGVGLPVYRITLPAPVESMPESLLGDRGALDALNINARAASGHDGERRPGVPAGSARPVAP